MNVTSHAERFLQISALELIVPAAGRKIIEGFVEREHANGSHSPKGGEHDQQSLGLRTNIVDRYMGIAQNSVRAMGGIERDQARLETCVRALLHGVREHLGEDTRVITLRRK